MHASLIAPQPLTTDRMEENVSLFGEADRGEPEPRLSVRVSVSLRFFDLVGLLAFHPSMMLTASELQCSDELAEALRFAIVDSGMSQIEEYAELARTALSHPRRSFHAYTKLVAEAVTRTFGMTAPQPPAAPAVNPLLLAAV
ncbi:hypothetical protein [Kitasatospora purpeofusca]|uniref:hypothetical protein n=1 Tax=Kitasatospora purpeofusca TaxID=67352 RepID=UPI00225C349A|nr:hypothetical protein [Kitasatospora purpeofusca]MCX4757831.1 hypothetical protein [Kitasatospora purpeofusca]WSR34475.1 hypothetical protein OG715_27975 [Kitasatospora purpeofusca]